MIVMSSSEIYAFIAEQGPSVSFLVGSFCAVFVAQKVSVVFLQSGFTVSCHFLKDSNVTQSHIPMERISILRVHPHAPH